jgi:hypothetical protein
MSDATSASAAVVSVVARMSDLESRQHVLAMQQKEADARAELLRQDVAAKTAELARLLETEKAVAGRVESEVLLGAKLASRVDDGAAALQAALLEQPILITATTAKIGTAGAKRARFEAAVTQLAAAADAWGAMEGSLTAPLLAQLAAADAQHADLLAEEAAAALPAPAAPTGDGDAAEAARLQQQLSGEQQAAADELAKQQRRVAAVKREVDDMRQRRDEVTQWVNDAVESKQQLGESMAVLRAAKATGVCAACTA